MPDIDEKPSNRLRNKLKEEKSNTEIEDIKEPKEKKEKKSALKDQSITKKEYKFVLKLRNYYSHYTLFFSDPKIKRISGLLLLLGSTYLSVAFTSFLFTWKTDQDKVMGSWSNLFFNELMVDNWLGKLGAIISHVFIHKWFGIASLIFPVIGFYAGIKQLLLLSFLKLKNVIAHSFFILVFTSIALGFVFNDKWFFLGGTFGYQLSNWFNLCIGKVGTVLLLLFSALTYAVVTYNITFNWKQKISNGLQPPLPNPAVVPANSEAASNKIVNLKVADPPFVISSEEEDIAEPEIIPAPANNEVIFELPIPIPEPIAANLSTDTIDFTIEKIEQAPDNELSEIVVTEEGKVDILKEFGAYDPTLDLSSYQFPSIDLLEEHKGNEINVNTEELTANKDRIVNTLKNYGIEIEKVKANVGPTVTLYEIIPKAGVRIAKIKSLEDDIALSLSALGIRIIAPIPGKGTIGIEVPNQNPQTVSMRSIIASDKFQNTTFDLPIALGKTISNETFIADLAKMPHLLMAGATGQGKSVGLNAILVSLLYKKHPSEVKFVLVDPKKVELTLFNKIERHFLAKLPDSEDAIITDNKKVINTLNSLCIEMDNRYELLKDAMVRNIKEYNTKFVARKLNPNDGHKFLPYIILVVDEFADLIMTAGKEVETPIARLAQLARAIGIHLIIATQRPSVNIITGTIKANFPARIAFRVTSKIDSRTILDSGGADQLIGRGDMLLSTGNDLIRIQCAFVDTSEVEKITAFIGGQRGYPHAFNLPEYIDENGEGNGAAELNTADRDKLFDDAARIIVAHQQGSASLLQRKLKLGYNRAGRIVDQLEAAGIIGPFEGSKARDVLIKDMVSLEQILNKSKEDTI